MKSLLFLMLLTFPLSAGCQDIRFVQDTSNHKVDIFAGDRLLTSFRYKPVIEKPFLFPIYAPNGTVITRGYPLEPRKGERADHPHHIGLWFNHGNVNGLDFWNNSSAIPDAEKDKYGRITVLKVTPGIREGSAALAVLANWEDTRGNVILSEETLWLFHSGDNAWYVDHLSTLKAVNGPVTITDSKEGMFAVRVDRAFEMPSEEKVIFTDEKGIPTTVERTDNTGVTGMYRSGSGKSGDAVWGTRNKWVILSGKKDNVPVSMAIFDHPSNPFYPAYAHARGYGLFSVNNFGRKSYDAKQEKLVFRLEKGESVQLRHRFYVQSGSELDDETADKVFMQFSQSDYLKKKVTEN